MRFPFAIAAVFLAAMGGAAAAGGTTPSATHPDLTATSWLWDVAPADDPATPEAEVARAQLDFSDVMVTTELGCNFAAGAYERQDSGGLVMLLDGKTKMGCYDPIYEDQFYQLLQDTVAYDVTEGQLHLFDNAGKLLATLEQN